MSNVTGVQRSISSEEPRTAIPRRPIFAGPPCHPISAATAEDLAVETEPRKPRKTRNKPPGPDGSGDILPFFFVSFRGFRGGLLAFAAATVASIVGQRIVVHLGRSGAVVPDLPDRTDDS
jgi:hypothetical protein